MTNDNKTLTLQSLKPILSAFEKKVAPETKPEIINSIEPLYDDIPTLRITGEIPKKKENVKAELKYTSKTHQFTAYIKYKLQGSNTLTNPKKNFTIQLFNDKNRVNELYKNFKSWGLSNRFVLKADYNDITHARNIVCAKLWSKIVASRSDYETLPNELKNSPNNGATDGFPVKVYINGNYQGLYCLTIPKNEWMFGMDKNNPNHVVLQAEVNDHDENGNLIAPENNPCNFNEPWSGKDGQYWSYEVGSDALDSWMSLYNSVQYENFDKEEVKKYLDIQSAMDYFLFQLVILGVDSLGKNVLLLTYDKIKWYLSAYDMDNTFDVLGKNILGEAQSDIVNLMPFLNKNNQLWPMVMSVFDEEVKNRYIELRNSVLSFSSIMEEFENFINIYGEDLYIKDTVVFPDIPNVEINNINYLKEFTKTRLSSVDYYLLGGALNV